MPEKRILIVDDDESIRKTLSLMFRKQYGIFLAKDAEEALHDHKNCKFELIIADLRLPGLSGLEMIARFRKLGFRGEAILISAHPDCVSIEDLGRRAVGHFFSKPLDSQALTRSIEYLLEPKEARA